MTVDPAVVPGLLLLALKLPALASDSYVVEQIVPAGIEPRRSNLLPEPSSTH